MPKALVTLADRLGTDDPDIAALVREALAEAARMERRAFLQRGWARAVLRDTQERFGEAAVGLRGGRHAIAVSRTPGDEWAAQYQRLTFRSARAAHGLGQFGTRSSATWGAHGFVRDSAEAIASGNRAALHRLRTAANAAKRRAGNPGPARVVILSELSRAEAAFAADPA